MPERPEIWLLARGEDLVAELEVEQLDAAWRYGHVLPREGFAALEPMFDREQRMAMSVDRDPAARADAYQELRNEVRLIRPDGHEASGFLLHIAGRQAWWRSCDRPSNPPVPGRPHLGMAQAAQRPPRRSLASAIAAVLMAFAVLPAAALARPARHREGSNWAGYAVTSRSPLRSVSRKWIQPAGTRDQPFATYSAFWVGLGGFKRGSQALHQIGTEADCTDHGRSLNFAWHELVPAPPVRLALKVRPGDRLAARVSVSGVRVVLHLQNLTTGKQFTKIVSIPSPDSTSAEPIAEAPSACDNTGNCQPQPLANFGTIAFTRANATTLGGHDGPISAPVFTATAVTLTSGGPVTGPQPAADAGGSPQAKPSDLSADGSAFTVAFTQQTLPPGQPPTAAPNQLRHMRWLPGPPNAPQQRAER
jgi:Peptidase A4 family